MIHYKKFYSGIKWNLAGSILYEGLKALHQILLLSVISPVSYGMIGTTFSVIYLCMNFANAGAATSVAPFLTTFTKNRKNFIKFFGGYLLAQVVILLLVDLAIYLSPHELLLSSNHLKIYIPLIIIVTEGIRSILRSLLHNLFLNKITITIESTLIIMYLSLIWVPYLLFKQPITLYSIFIPYLITSVLALVLFFAVIIEYYNKLPRDDMKLPNNLLHRIIKARFYNYSTRITRHIFTGNFLVPLFALRFGLAEAGIFKFASYLSDSIRGIMNATIGFSGAALLANLKNATLHEKRKAFHIISEKLNTIIYFILIFLVINTKFFNIKATLYQPYSILLFTLFFLFIALLEHFFIVYDQFYIIEELSNKLFTFKLLEVALFYGVIILSNNFSPAFTLINLIVVRSTTFLIIATSSYARWKITPKFTTQKKYIVFSFIVSIFSYCFLSYIS